MNPRPCPRMRVHHALRMAYVAWRVGPTRIVKYLGPAWSEKAEAMYRRFCRAWESQTVGILLRRGRWSTPRLLTHDGKTLSVAKWAKLVGVRAGTIRWRLDVLGWSVEQALATPARVWGCSSGRRKNPRTVP